jgi:hypothetical protein
MPDASSRRLPALDQAASVGGGAFAGDMRLGLCRLIDFMRWASISPHAKSCPGRRKPNAVNYQVSIDPFALRLRELQRRQIL